MVFKAIRDIDKMQKQLNRSVYYAPVDKSIGVLFRPKRKGEKI